MNQFVVAGSFLVSFGASAAGLPCSIHPPKSVADSALPALAKVSKADAESTALRAVKVEGASVTSGELEAEGNCLIYSFDIAMPDKKSIVEVAVDAGTGRVLSQKRESAKTQAAEAASDLAVPKKK